MRIDILVFDGADEIDFVGPQEVFRRAAKIEKDIEVELVTLEPQSEVTAQFGLRVHPDGVLNTAPDLVVVPGGGWVANSNNGIRREIAHGALTKTLSSLHESQVILAGVCTGAMALAAALLSPITARWKICAGRRRALSKPASSTMAIFLRAVVSRRQSISRCGSSSASGAANLRIK